MRREELYLADILEAIDSIGNFINDIEKSEFIGNDLLRSAVLQKLLIIGEAAARLPRPFRENHIEVPWQDIIAFRNIAIHAYFSIDWNIVWVTATGDIPSLRSEINNILSSGY